MGQAVDEHVIGFLCVLVAVVAGGFDVAHVAGNSGNAEEAALLVHHGVHLLGGHAGHLHEEGDDGGVHVAAARAHDEAHQRREAHGRVDDFAAVNGAEGAAVAEVAVDDLRLGGIEAEEFAGVVIDELVAGAMEAVFADGILFIVFARDGVHVGFGAHRLMESRVEDGDVRDAGEDLFAGFDAAEIGRIVERAERDAGADAVFHGFIDDDRSRVFHAAMEDAVADGFDFGKALQNTVLRIDQLVADGFEGFAMILDRQDFLELLTFRLVDHLGVVHADAFDEAFGKDGLVRHVKKGEFEGRASGVDDQDFHVETP